MDAEADQAEPLPPGQILATERERQGLSRAEIAQRLHMSPSQVEALETGEYERLPKGPFLRGFVRNYAKALGLDADALLAQLAEAGPHESAPRIVVPSQNIRFEPLGDRLSNPYIKAAGLAAVAVALSFAAMYWWLFIRPTALGASAHKNGVEQPAKTAPVAGAPEVTPATSQHAPAPDARPAPPAPVAPATEASKADAAKPAALRKAEPLVASEPPKPAPPAAGEAVLQFHFNGESWVEVRDARDRVVMQRINAANTDTEVRGPRPLKVIVGNAADVSLRVNDRNFPLEPHTKVAVARFTVE